MIGFIDDHRGAYGVEPICKLLPIAPSTYHAHAARRADPARLPARARRDVVLATDIQRVFDANFGVYGVRKVWRQLGREGKKVVRCTVAWLMRRMGLQGVVRGREIRTTVSNPAFVCPLDRVTLPLSPPKTAFFPLAPQPVADPVTARACVQTDPIAASACPSQPPPAVATTA